MRSFISLIAISKSICGNLNNLKLEYVSVSDFISSQSAP